MSHVCYFNQFFLAFFFSKLHKYSLFFPPKLLPNEEQFVGAVMATSLLQICYLLTLTLTSLRMLC